jgi:hypothetical protein
MKQLIETYKATNVVVSLSYFIEVYNFIHKTHFTAEQLEKILLLI